MERLEQLDAARATYQTVFDGYMRIHGPRHRTVADMHAHLGDILLKQGNAEEARARYAEALAVLRKHPGPDDPDTLEVISHDADALFAMGRKVAGRNQARSVAETFRRTLGPNNGLTRRAETQVERMTPRRRSR
jgi:tetratricopeptide (TPR) repeat protein